MGAATQSISLEQTFLRKRQNLWKSETGSQQLCWVPTTSRKLKLFDKQLQITLPRYEGVHLFAYIFLNSGIASSNISNES